jgi:T5SS/PEP-CTERM-associated repeat protein
VANITVDGAGSELNLSSLFRINRGSSTGTTTTQVTVSNGGTVDANGTIYLAEQSGGSGTIEVNSGGTFDGRDFIIGRFAGSDGRLIVTGAGSTASTSNSASIKVGEEGTGAMDILNGGAVTTTNGTPIIGNLAGSNGTVTINGTGSEWTLSGSGTGGVTVGGSGTGSLNVSNGGLLVGSATVGTSGSLSGDGLISGTVTNSGLVSPGNSPGILTILGDYTQTNNGILQIELGGTTVGTEYDQLLSGAGGAINLDGTLNIVSINSFAPTAGDSFQIFDFSTGINGSFETINTFNPGSGLAWDLENLYTTGEISVIPEPATAAAFLGALALGLVLCRRKR